jgi:hypothetical protein
MKRKYLNFAGILLAGTLLFASPAYAATVEYDNLRQLLIDGNLDLQDTTDTFYTNISNYENMIAELTDERDYMKLKKEQSDDDDEAKQQYSKNASSLSSAIERLRKQLDRQTSNSSYLTLNKAIDSYTMTAQTLMNTYKQKVLNMNAKEKTTAAAQKNYETVLLKYEAGAATDADVMTASDQLMQAQNLLSSYQQEASDLRFQLLSMLGITDSEDVTIGDIPSLDVSLIDAIDFESDLTKAVNNSTSVKNVRHTNAGSMGEIDAKETSETAAVGTQTASFTDTYQQLLAERTSYEAALDAFASAEISYNTLNLKKQAGMLSEADYLTGEASYLEALAQKETASMNLYQAYQDYQWELIGLGNSQSQGGM